MSTPSQIPEGRKRVGDFLIEKGLISQEQIPQILAHSKKTDLRFGEACVDLKLIRRSDLVKLFGPNSKIDFFHLNAKYFPPQTADLFDVRWMIQQGVIPLGIKTEVRFFRARKYLNLGLLDPSDQGIATAALNLAGTKFPEGYLTGIKKYLVLAEQMIDVLHQHYGISPVELRSWPAPDVHETLQLFLYDQSSDVRTT